MINHASLGRGIITTRMTDSPNSGIKLDLGKGDMLVIGDFRRKTFLTYTGRSAEGNLSFSIGENRLGVPAPSQNHFLETSNRLLQFSGRSFLVSESDQERIMLQYER